MTKREQGKLQTTDKYVTQRDVADRAGVSPSIVSYVINNGPRSISEETRQRVLHAIAELNYRPNIHAQKLMLASWENELAPGQFGVVVGASRDFFLRPYYLTMIYSVLEEATHHALSMRFMLFYDELNKAQLFQKLINPEEISALILIKAGPRLWSDEGGALIERMRARVPNIVSVGRVIDGVPSITFDVREAMYKATSYLLSLGHRRLAYIGTLETRLEGFQQAFNDLHLEHDPQLVVPLVPYNTTESGYQAARALMNGGKLQDPTKVTGIVTGSDEVAWGVMRACQESGLRIPEDLSITSIDDDHFNRFLTPALTTVKVPKEEMGRAAINLMLQRKGHLNDPPPILTLPTELIIRESCAPPAV